MTDLLSALSRFTKKKIMVVGDLGMDEYVQGEVRRISPEAPVPVVEVETEDQRVGLSGNVAQNITSLGAEPLLISVIGDDDAGVSLKRLLSKEGVDADSLVVDASRPTTRKLRIMTGQYHITRVDYEKKRFLSAEVEEQLFQQIQRHLGQTDAIILQDYAKGVVSESLAQRVLQTAREASVPVLVDPHRTAPAVIYRGATVFKPNFDEAIALSGLPAESLHRGENFISELAQAIQQNVQAEHLVITRGKEGISLFSREQAVHVPTVAKQVFDVTGAGDTVIAALAVAHASGLSLEESCQIANFGAGVVVAKVGCVPLHLAELEQAIQVASE